MDVADIPVMIIVGHVEGRRAAKGSDVATRGGESATQRHGLSTCHPDSSRLGIEPKTPGWLVQAPTTSPSGDLIPTIRGSGAHPGRTYYKAVRVCVYYCSVCVYCVCVFYYCRTYYKAVRVGGGGEWRTCAMRDDEPRPVCMSLPITHWDL